MHLPDAHCGRVVVPEGAKGYQHGFFFVDFLLLALSYEKLEETGKKK